MPCRVWRFIMFSRDSGQAKGSYCVKHFKSFTLRTFSKNRMKKNTVRKNPSACRNIWKSCSYQYEDGSIWSHAGNTDPRRTINWANRERLYLDYIILNETGDSGKAPFIYCSTSGFSRLKFQKSNFEILKSFVWAISTIWPPSNKSNEHCQSFYKVEYYDWVGNSDSGDIRNSKPQLNTSNKQINPSNSISADRA